MYMYTCTVNDKYSYIITYPKTYFFNYFCIEFPNQSHQRIYESGLFCWKKTRCNWVGYHPYKLVSNKHSRSTSYGKNQCGPKVIINFTCK